MKRETTFLRGLAIGSIVLFIVGWQSLGFQWNVIRDGTKKLGTFLTHMWPFDVSNADVILRAGVESFQIAFLGTTFGVALSFVLAFFAASNTSPHWLIARFFKALAGVVRAIPALIWVLLFIVAVGMGAFPGILALAFNSTGMLVKMFAQSIEEVDEGVIESARSTGANRLQVIGRAVVPTVFTSLVAWSLFRFEINFRYATILGMVGAGGIGWELTSAMRMYRLDEAAFIIVVIFVMVYTVELIGNRLKRSYMTY